MAIPTVIFFRGGVHPPIVPMVDAYVQSTWADHEKKLNEQSVNKIFKIVSTKF